MTRSVPNNPLTLGAISSRRGYTHACTKTLPRYDYGLYIVEKDTRLFTLRNYFAQPQSHPQNYTNHFHKLKTLSFIGELFFTMKKMNRHLCPWLALYAKYKWSVKKGLRSLFPLSKVFIWRIVPIYNFELMHSLSCGSTLKDTRHINLYGKHLKKASQFKTEAKKE